MSVSTVSAQNATVWGPGENYEIDYLHSGTTQINETTEQTFSDVPSTEFVLQNITNTGYDYIGRFYGGIQVTDSIRITSYNIPGSSTFEFPIGGFPVVLPLSFGEEDDWPLKFAQQINTLSQTAQEEDTGSFGGELAQANATIQSNNIILRFQTYFNESSSLEDNQQLFQTLPQQLPETLNGTYINGTLYTELNYKRSTGALFSMIFFIDADNFENTQGELIGPIYTTQDLEFVAIIPPSDVLDTFGLQFSLLGLIILPAYFVIKRH